jgi:very-short-patch-repair endonuclease
MPDFNNNLHNNANPSTYEIAKYLRKEQTAAEEILWQNLRNRKVGNLKFRRQHAFENYVLDFYCHEIKLAIEADGSIHNEPYNKAYDTARTTRLNEYGINVLRFTNDEIENNIVTVINNINEWVKENNKKIPDINNLE